jgi:RNA polymerase sigma factor (sigma-70 family)
VLPGEAAPGDPLEEAVVAFQAGRDREASFRCLVDSCYHPIRAFFARRVGSAEEALELTQDTFLRIYKGLDRFRRESRFRTWAFRVAHTTYLQWLERRRARLEVAPFVAAREEAGMEDPQAVPVERRTPLDSVLERERSPTAFDPPPTGEDFELAAFHRSLRAKLAPASPRAGARGVRWARALAASLGLVVLGLGFWSHLQGRRLAELARPLADAPVLDLPQGGARSEAAAVWEVPAGGFHLVLTPDVDETYPRYRLRLRTEPHRLAVVEELRPDPSEGTLTLWLPPGALPAGAEVERELFGVSEGREVRVLAQRLRTAPRR